MLNPETVNKGLTYAEMGRMAMTHRRIDEGFKVKMGGRFQQHTKTSSDNMFSADFNKYKSKPQPKRKVKVDITQTTSSGRNPLFGGSEVIMPVPLKLPHQGSIQSLLQYERKYTLPADRTIPPRRKYAQNGTLTLSHIYEPLSKEKVAYKQRSRSMKDLLQYRFASHSCEFVSPKITQSLQR